MRKMATSIRLACDLIEGHILSEKDLVFKAPNDGLDPFEINKLIGKKINKSLNSDELITFDDII